MKKSVNKKELDVLLNFIGYGSLKAEIWFIGMEEAGGGENNISARLNFEPIMDCSEAHKLLGIFNLHFEKVIIQKTWRGMCYVMLCLNNEQPTRENIRNYQSRELGKRDGRTLLTELMPIPKPKINSWNYDELIPQYNSSKEYYEKVMPYRINYLKGIIEQNTPKVIIAYGKKYWNYFKELFPNNNFTPEGQFEIAYNKKTLFILTDHFTSRTMNGKFDNIVSIIKKYQHL